MTAMIAAGVVESAPCDRTAPVAAVKFSPVASVLVVANVIVELTPVVELEITKASRSASYVQVPVPATVAVPLETVPDVFTLTVPVPAAVVYVPKLVIVLAGSTPVPFSTSPIASFPVTVEAIVTTPADCDAVPLKIAEADCRPVVMSAAALLKLVALARLIAADRLTCPSIVRVSVPDSACSCARLRAATLPPRRYAPTAAVLNWAKYSVAGSTVQFVNPAK